VSEKKSSFPVRETSSSHSEKRGTVRGRESEKEGAAGQTGWFEIHPLLQRQRHGGIIGYNVLLGNASLLLTCLSLCFAVTLKDPDGKYPC
jgi:hypothetical protein